MAQEIRLVYIHDTGNSENWPRPRLDIHLNSEVKTPEEAAHILRWAARVSERMEMTPEVTIHTPQEPQDNPQSGQEAQAA